MKAPMLTTTLSALLSAGPAAAVVLAPDNLGQVLLYPYYTVEGGTNTLLSVENTTPRGKAAKVRFLEALNGRRVMDLNLYLGPHDVWTAMITADAGGGAKLVVNDSSCTAPAIATALGGTGEQPFLPYWIDGWMGAPADAEASRGIARTREGYIEVIEMGDIDPEYQLPGGVNFLAAIVPTMEVPKDCKSVYPDSSDWYTRFKNDGHGSAVATADVRGLYATSGGLAGTGTLINVAQGTDYSYDPVALAGFYMGKPPMHTAPGADGPSLADAHPSSSVTVVDSDTGIPTTKTDDWTNPGAGPLAGIDAVSAVLMRLAATNQFVINADIHAGTDWVLTVPTKSWYVDQVLRPVRPFSSTFGPGGACEQVTLRHHSMSGHGPGWIHLPLMEPRYHVCWQVNVLTFGDPVLGSTLPVEARQPPFDFRLGRVPIPAEWPAGQLRVGFDSVEFYNDRSQYWSHATDRMWSTSADLPSHKLFNEAAPHHTYEGLPVIGFAVQRYVNDVLPGGVLSNYGGTYVHRYERRVTP